MNNKDKARPGPRQAPASEPPIPSDDEEDEEDDEEDEPQYDEDEPEYVFAAQESEWRSGLSMFIER